jgi:26S proteasome regulatory subunit T4
VQPRIPHACLGNISNCAMPCSGLFAIKEYRDAIKQDDFNRAVRKVAEAKKLEGKLEYQKL